MVGRDGRSARPVVAAPSLGKWPSEAHPMRGVAPPDGKNPGIPQCPPYGFATKR